MIQNCSSVHVIQKMFHMPNSQNYIRENIINVKCFNKIYYV